MFSRSCFAALCVSLLAVSPPVAADAQFARGDVNSNDAVDLVDAVALLAYLFVPNAPVPLCVDAGDTNDDGSLGIPDAVALLGYLFVPGSPAPEPPFPSCGNDSTADSLSCIDTNTCTTSSVWQQAPALPIPRGAHASAVVGGKIYVLGGGIDWGGGNTTQVNVYDPTPETWTPGTPVPDANTWGAVAEVVAGRIYLIGGWPSGGNSIRRYDPVADSWEPLAASPVSFRWGHASAVVGTNIHVIGGFPSGLSQQVYDTVNDTWSPAANALMISQRGRAEAIAARVFLVGTLQPRLQVYDPAVDSWSFGPDLPVQTQVPATVVRDGQLWVLGGATQDPLTGGNLSVAQSFDPVTQSWSLGPSMPTCRSWATAALVGARIHVLGGLNSMNDALDAHEILD